MINLHHKPIQWSDDLVIDNGMIDDDHRYLIELTNKFLLREQRFDSSEQALDLINNLRDYASAHFRREENLQKKVGFPVSAKHKRKHLELERSLAAMDNVIRNSKAGNLEEIAADVSNLLRDWLVIHILKHDISMRKYVVNMNTISKDVVSLRDIAFV